MEQCFENEKASVLRELDSNGDLIKIEIKYNDASRTVEEYYIEEEIPIYARHTKYTILTGVKATDVSLRCGVSKQQLPNKLKEIIAELME